MQFGVECGTWPRLRTLVAGSESSSPVESTPIVGVGYTYITTLALSDKNFFGKKIYIQMVVHYILPRGQSLTIF